MARKRKAHEKLTSTPEDKHYPTKNHLELFRAILELKNSKEAVAFFRDLLTIPEIEEFSRRWQIAKLLFKGHSYVEVAGKTGASTTTVARVAKWLFEGKDGYQTILHRLRRKSS